jgi:hypothetical protein
MSRGRDGNGRRGPRVLNDENLPSPASPEKDILLTFPFIEPARNHALVLAYHSGFFHPAAALRTLPRQRYLNHFINLFGIFVKT